MPSAQDCAERLREQAYRTLLPQIQELQNLGSSLSTGVKVLEQKLEALSHIELPTTELVLAEILGDIVKQKDLETSALGTFARGLKTKETQEEILSLLLDAAQKYFKRAALFAVRGNRFVGWSSRGYSEDSARKISSSTFLRRECPAFENTLEAAAAATGMDLAAEDSVGFLNGDAHGPYCLMPLYVLQRPVALLAAGGADDDAGSVEALSIAAEFTMLRLENIALKILYELKGSEQEQAQSAADPVVTAVTPEPQKAELRFAAAAPAAESAPVSRFDLDFQTPSPEEPEPAASFVAIEEPPAMETGFSEELQIPQEQAPLVTQAQEIKPIPEEEKIHSEAKRFARLLVSEIKLYNENYVVEGRQNQDLYLRLKRDIDRSREMYEKRVSPDVSRKIDYFHDEIVRILGDNDPSTLGSDYPGPRVES